MDTKQKDNFTDVVDYVSNQPTPSTDSIVQSGQVQTADGQVVTLGNEGGQNKAVDTRYNQSFK